MRYSISGFRGLSAWLLVLVSSLLFSSSIKAEDRLFWQALAQGGKVVLIQHALLDEAVGDPFSLDPSCFIERNLSEAGREQARSIGEAFRQQGIKIDAVWASPHCRTKDTAELAFGEFEVKAELRLIRALTEEQANANLRWSRQLIGNFNAEGNLILVTHRPNIGELIHQRVRPGTVAVVEPLGDGLFDLVATKVFD
ncbi:histidine phosphatase family protein [Thiomicrospira microaerophila]|uniref:histidine phosphatase family protein n=1 Tax=Thiomicrospira microaerophila TaxID=406020 RepID=UPI00200F1285|nr:histidine phosphatase family protein [Thiomicrospira microaerophila]UQB42405.1 histidine phosphatase family protein [Thiomicrospira microaerophila]